MGAGFSPLYFCNITIGFSRNLKNISPTLRFSAVTNILYILMCNFCLTKQKKPLKKGAFNLY